MNLFLKTKLFKGFILLILLSFLSFTGCVNFKSSSITGNGKTVNGEKTVDNNFKNIYIKNIQCKIILTNEKSDKIKYSIDESLEKLLVINVTNEKLNIESSNGRNLKNKKNDLTFYISTDYFERIDLVGAAEVNANGYKDLGDVYINSSGASSLNLDIECKTLSVDISGAGKSKISGKGKEVKFYASGAVLADLKDFIVDDADINLSGTAKLDIFAEKNSKISASGMAKVNYYGNAVPSTNISGAASITKGD